MSGYVLPPGGGRSFGPGISVKVEHGVSPSFAVFESVVPPLWPGPGPHLHREYDEAVHVLDGTVAFTLDGAETLVVARMAGKSPWALRVAIHRGLHQLAASADWGCNATNGPGVFTVRCLGFPFPAGPAASWTSRCWTCS